MEPRDLKIGQATKLLGTTPPVWRDWHVQGELVPARITRGGTRYYDIHDRLQRQTPNVLTLGYARVSRADPKDDLRRQQAMLEAYCAPPGGQTEIITDLGSGLNYRKPGLQRLQDLILRRGVARWVRTHRDRPQRSDPRLRPGVPRRPERRSA